jgi:hypothetical protein
MRNIVTGLAMLRQLAQKLGPYLILEILLPGGTLFALLLFAWQRGRLGGFDTIRTTVMSIWSGVDRL